MTKEINEMLAWNISMKEYEGKIKKAYLHNSSVMIELLDGTFIYNNNVPESIIEKLKYQVVEERDKRINKILKK